MPYASYLAIRKMAQKRLNRTGYSTHLFDIVIMTLMTLIFMGMCFLLD
jgi:hypothetical protein